ncbi:MAG: DedA family protein [Candidatus Thioglobus sp.]|nr:DedA family protein [Candidatus Thioglobus sp.]
MKIFSSLYNLVLSWAKSRFSLYYLCALSFVESFVLPYPPPDLLLAPMALKNPNQAYRFAFFCTISSVLGGIFGYLIGSFFIDLAMNFFTEMNYLGKLNLVKSWFDEYGILIIAIAGFSPIPYKIFTITAGIVAMAFLPFVLMSIFARGARFFLVAFFVKKFGNSCDVWLQKYIDRLGYGLILIIIIGVWYAK